MSCVRNTAIDYLRTERRRAYLFGQGNLSPISNKQWLCTQNDSSEYTETLHVALTKIPRQEFRVAIYKIQQYSDSEISKRLQLSPSTIRVYWYRAKKHLKQVLLFETIHKKMNYLVVRITGSYLSLIMRQHHLYTMFAS